MNLPAALCCGLCTCTSLQAANLHGTNDPFMPQHGAPYATDTPAHPGMVTPGLHCVNGILLQAAVSSRFASGPVAPAAIIPAGAGSVGHGAAADTVFAGSRTDGSQQPPFTVASRPQGTRHPGPHAQQSPPGRSTGMHILLFDNSGLLAAACLAQTRFTQLLARWS